MGLSAAGAAAFCCASCSVMSRAPGRTITGSNAQRGGQEQARNRLLGIAGLAIVTRCELCVRSYAESGR